MSKRIPLATYRLQLSANFGFRDAIGVLDYLRDLGISHVYVSPILTSRHGSGHGYDATDPTKIDPDLGGQEGFTEFQAAAEERGMGLLLDIVPNHMAASSENRWWMDVLEYGPDSPFASYFDINWRPLSRILENKILLPTLAKPFGEALEGGELQIHFEDGKFLLHYEGQTFPIAPSSYAEILRCLDAEGRHAGATNSSASDEWQGIVSSADSIAADKSAGAQSAAERRTKLGQLSERLRDLNAASPDIAAFLKDVLREINGITGSPRSFSKLERILSAQNYRLAFWQTPSETINYRRFFSITDLVGVRVEDPAVFDATHELVIGVGSAQCDTGFRIDHIDGLRDPRGYLSRLSERLSANAECNEGRYIVVEKILVRNESLPADWPVEGTTGYDYLNYANRLLVDDSQMDAIRGVYARWTKSEGDFADIVYQKKKLVMRTLLGVEVRSLGRELAALALDDRYARDLNSSELTDALSEVIACLPVYRTYIQTFDVPAEAQEVVTQAIRDARERKPTLQSACFDFISDVLLLAAREHVRADQREARLVFVTRWQQITGSIMAKGFEDTTLYVYFPLASLNEVGGDPRGLDSTPAAFHEFIRRRQIESPHSMNATTTHDTKRSESVRARIAVLSEIPGEWENALQEWSRMNEKFLATANGSTVPDRNEEYLFYQTLIGTWPLREEDWDAFVPRLQEYVMKATREAMVHTRWTRPNEAHESALRDFVAGVLDRERNAPFRSSFEKFQERTALYGMLNGIGQTLLKAICPGVPDCYQGAELWDLRLVDPDNRGAIDFQERADMLARLYGTGTECAQQAECLLEKWRDSRVKLHVLAQSLRARRENPELFANGDYLPLEITGRHETRAIAFARRHGSGWAIAAIPRCVASVRAPVFGDRSEFWKDTSVILPAGAPGKWRNALADDSSAVISGTNQRLTLGEVFESFPLALLLPIAE